jgi:hypothetical protein
MNTSKKHPKLIGMSHHDERELNSIEEVAKYICEKGVSSDVTITYEDGTPFLNTFGIYIDRISDMNYRSELLKVLIPMQKALDGTEEIFDLDGSEEMGIEM